MAARNSTSSTNTANRLKSKTSDFSDFLRWREHAHPSSSNALSDSMLSDASRDGSTSKAKRRIPFLGLRKKVPVAGGMSATSTGIPLPASPSAVSLSKSTPPRLSAGAPSHRSPRLPDPRAVSPSTLRPTRSITPTSPHLLSPASLPTTSSLSAAAHADGPEITVSEASPERPRANRIASSPSLHPPQASHPNGPAVDFPTPSDALSDSEVSKSTNPTRDRKSSLFDRFKGHSTKPALARSSTTASSTNAPTKRPSISPAPVPSLRAQSQARLHARTPSHSSKPSGSSQELEAILHIGKDLPSVPASGHSTPVSSARSSPSTGSRRNTASSSRQTSTSMSSARAPSVASVRTSDSSTPSPRISSATPSKLGHARTIARTSSINNKHPPARSSPVPSSNGSSSWLLTKNTSKTSPATASALENEDPARPSQLSSTSNASSPTRGRSTSDPHVLETALAEKSTTLSVSTTTKPTRQSLQGSPSTTLLSPGGAPPQGPLPEPPAEPASEAESVASSPVRSSLRPLLLSMPSMTSSLSSMSRSTSISANTIATTISTTSSTASRLPTIPSGVALVSKLEDRRSAAAATPKKSSPPSSPSTPPVIVPLAPTPANIYALQAENAALKQKVESLERAARRHEREIRGLRWLVVNGNPTIRPLPSRPAASAGAAAVATAPTSPISEGSRTAFSDSEGPLSDGTTDAGSAIARYGSKVLRGFESDTGAVPNAVTYARKPASAYSSASEASGLESSTRKRPLAVQRARAAREEADKVLARSGTAGISVGSVEFSVAVDLAAQAEPIEEASEVQLIEREPRMPDSRRSSESTTPTSPVLPPHPPPPLPTPTKPTPEESRMLKEERRASKVLKRISGLVQRHDDSHALYAANLSRGLAPSIEQVMDTNDARNRPSAITRASS